MADFTREQFADDVRSARLTTLLRWSLIGGIIAVFLIVTAGLMSRTDIMPALLPMAVVMAGTLLGRSLQQRVSYSVDAGLYVLTLLAAITVAMFITSADGARISPFFFPLVVFIIGTLFPPSRAILSALYAVVIVIVASIARPEVFPFGWPSIGAMVLSLAAAGIAALVTGDLYQIAEWSMFNYARERRIAGELFDNRVELERSLARSQALSDRLQETNLALDAARLSAEEAKHFRGQFLANMSHELRTPLNAIIGFSETMLNYPMMYDGVTLPRAYEADLSQIYTSGQELLKLINDILDLSKVDAGKLEIRVTPLKLVPLIENVMQTATGLVSKKPIRLLAELPPDLPPVLADDQRVRQVLFNLYSNAAKFTDAGTITIRAQAYDHHVRVSVTDTGSGIAPENHAVIFEEFKQAQTEGRDPRSGAGLGLAISRQLLTLMNGRIWVESALGEGSTFSFTLPRADLHDSAPTPAQPATLVAAYVESAGTAS